MRLNIHYGNSRDFPDAPAQVSITSSHDVAPVLLDSFTDAIISIGPFMGTWQLLYPWILEENGGRDVSRLAERKETGNGVRVSVRLL